VSALRYNEGKPELSYILSMPRMLEALAKVFSQGAIKYERDNWQRGGKPDTEYKDSLLRHLLAMEKGEMYDHDTGCLHAAHAIWNLGALIELNYGGVPALDPGFDQQAFIDKYDRPAIRPALPYQYTVYEGSGKTFREMLDLNNKENTSK
jgi:hypothetical protein